MPTMNQLVRKGRTKRRKNRHKRTALGGAPQLSGLVRKTGITNPKKPNSAERKTARVKLSNGREVTVMIPGEGHNLQEHSRTLVEGGRKRDLIGIRHQAVRGAIDLQGVTDRKTSRSRYGVKIQKGKRR